MVDWRMDGWQIRSDRDATVAAYRLVGHGAQDECSCLYCKNYRVAFEPALSDTALQLFEDLGIDHSKPAETTEYGPSEGLILYGAWWHFAGRVVADPGNQLVLPASSSGRAAHAFFSHRSDLAHEPLLRAGQLVQLDLTIHLPWLLSEPYPRPL
jgi:hypothetical protein